MWGYYADGEHRLLVYEYMEHGSLAKNLSVGTLDWEKMFEIAQGTAKGLAYLIEDCLEWVLHCNVKPQNILLDSNYHPKCVEEDKDARPTMSQVVEMLLHHENDHH
nr:putative receptor protein kinase zmpk1 [Quercus suber]